MAFIQNKNSFLRVGNNYYPDIEGLRAIAIIGVVLYHFSPSLLREDFLALIFFFAISGFLITKFIFDSTKAEPFNKKNGCLLPN
jgi:peptidoglycan/LPS O-acetylase OafA/YrhL